MASFSIPFSGLIQWPHVDLGNLGVTKNMIGFDVVAEAPEGLAVSIGYDQRNLASRTTDFDIDGDTLPAQLVPMPLSAPSFDMRLTFAPGQAWKWYASVLYVNDQRRGS
jgi:hypothetical protein